MQAKSGPLSQADIDLRTDADPTQKTGGFSFKELVSYIEYALEHCDDVTFYSGMTLEDVAEEFVNKGISKSIQTIF